MTPGALQIQSPLAPLLLQRHREVGGDVAALCAQLDVPPDSEEKREIPITVASLKRLCDAVERSSRDRFVGLHLAATIPRGSYGVLELAGSNAPDLRAALVRLQRYIRLVNPSASFTVEEDGLETRLEHRVLDRRPDMGRHMHEFILASLVRIGRRLCGGAWRIERVWFAHPRPGTVDELAGFFGTRALHFDRESNGLAFPGAQLALPVEKADPVLLPILDQHAHLLLPRGDTPPPGDWLDQLRDQLRSSLGDGEVNLEALARRLRISARTLQRRLGEADTSFQQVLDEVRHELAQRYLGDPRLHLGEVAFLLGYSEFRAFARAFKRWTGQSPGDFRKSLPA